MKGIVVLGCVAVTAAAAIMITAEQGSAKDDPVARGKYLVTLSGCNDCHSPKVYTPEGEPQPDEKKLLSGHPAGLELPAYSAEMVAPGAWVLLNDHFTAFVGPWGVSYSANLTPDKETGIGSWPEEMFLKAMRTGKHLGSGRPILPPMPWFNLAMATDEDLKAMFVYLKSIPPVKNQVPDPVPPHAPAK